MERSCLSRRLTHLGICYSCSIVRPYLPYQHLGLSVALSLRKEKMFVPLYVNENLNCRIRDMKPYREVFAPKTENMWRIIYYPGHQHDWNMRLISEKISVRFRCGVATG